jgi:hypothetical protein
MMSSTTELPPASTYAQYVSGVGTGGSPLTAFSEVGGNGLAVMEYMTSIYSNMSLSSVPVTAMDVPSVGRMLFLYRAENASITLNTDIKAYVSRNGGVNYTQVILTDEGPFLGTHDGSPWATAPTDDGTYRIVAGTAVLTDQTLTYAPTSTHYPNGAPEMVWNIQTFNNKYQKVRGVSHMWY